MLPFTKIQKLIKFTCILTSNSSAWRTHRRTAIKVTMSNNCTTVLLCATSNNFFLVKNMLTCSLQKFQQSHSHPMHTYRSTNFTCQYVESLGCWWKEMKILVSFLVHDHHCTHQYCLCVYDSVSVCTMTPHHYWAQHCLLCDGLLQMVQSLLPCAVHASALACEPVPQNTAALHYDKLAGFNNFNIQFITFHNKLRISDYSSKM